MLPDFPSYGCVSGVYDSVSSGMMWGLVWVGFFVARPGVIVTWSFTFTLWRVAGSIGTYVSGCCLLGCGGFGISTLGNCAGGGAGAWGTDVLKMAASCLSAIFCFFPRFGMGLDVVGWCSASVRSASALVTVSAIDRLGKFFWAVNSSVVLDKRSDAVFGI